MFDNSKLDDFKPDIIYIHTTSKNITEFEFNMKNSAEAIEYRIKNSIVIFETMWQSLKNIIVRLFKTTLKMPSYRLLGNKDVSDIHSKLWFINLLNINFMSMHKITIISI